MGDVEWTNEAVIRLIQEYQKRAELWDSRHDLFRVQTAKYEAWADLASTFECDIGDLRKKLNSIFASHRREKAKVRCGGRSTWFLYPYMKFLPTHLENGQGNDDGLVIMPSSAKPIKRSKPAVQQTSEQSSEDEEDDDQADDDQEVHEEIIIKQEVPSFKSRFRRIAPKARLTRPVKKRIIKDSSVSQLDSKLLETLRLLRRADLSRKKDECDSFGEYIADSLRKHDDRTQSMIKQAINNILFEQEMKKYGSNQYAVVISGMDDNPLILGDQDNSDR